VDAGRSGVSRDLPRVSGDVMVIQKPDPKKRPAGPAVFPVSQQSPGLRPPCYAGTSCCRRPGRS
jgi:hypothetical protein